MTDDITRAMDQLDDMLIKLAYVRTHLPLAHELAFTTGGKKPDNDGGPSFRLAHYGDETGDERARQVWNWARAMLDGELAAALPKVVLVERRMRKLLTEGEVDAKLEGSLIKPEELDEALAMQRKRGGKPAFEPQPKHPKGRK